MPPHQIKKTVCVAFLGFLLLLLAVWNFKGFNIDGPRMVDFTDFHWKKCEQEVPYANFVRQLPWIMQHSRNKVMHMVLRKYIASTVFMIIK